MGPAATHYAALGDGHARCGVVTTRHSARRRAVDCPYCLVLMAEDGRRRADAPLWERRETPARKRRRRKGAGGKPRTGRGPAEGRRRIPPDRRGKRPANFRWRKRR